MKAQKFFFASRPAGSNVWQLACDTAKYYEGVGATFPISTVGNNETAHEVVSGGAKFLFRTEGVASVDLEWEGTEYRVAAL